MALAAPSVDVTEAQVSSAARATRVQRSSAWPGGPQSPPPAQATLGVGRSRASGVQAERMRALFSWYHVRAAVLAIEANLSSEF